MILKLIDTPLTLTYTYYGFTFVLPFGDTPTGVERIGNLYYIHLIEKDPLEVKACYKCKRLLSPLQFYDPTKSPCKCCHIIAVKNYRKNNPEKEKIFKARANRKYRLKKKPCI